MAFSLLWKSGGDAPHEPCFAEIVDEWAENARTNALIETHRQFVDRKVIPLVLREVRNPFVAGGAEADKPWAEEGNALFGTLLHVVCDEDSSAWYYGENNASRAAELVKRGCRDPLIRIFAALDPLWSNDEKRVAAELDKIEKSIADRKGGFLWMLIGYYRQRVCSTVKEDRFKVWFHNGNFTADDEPALYQLAATFATGHMSFEDLPQFGWADALTTASVTMKEGQSSAGFGIPAKITGKGWADLAEKSEWAMKDLEEAERIAPNRAETARLGLSIEGGSRHGRGECMDDLFRRMSLSRLDDPIGLNRYVIYRLYPRWLGDRNYRGFLHFAEACYSTGRHDTCLPYLYAEMQCRYVRDAKLDPRRYFRENPEIADRCIDVCLRQVTNESTCAAARIRAPFVGSYVAFNVGRYDLTNLYGRIDWTNHAEADVRMIFPDADAVYTLRALGGKHASFCANLQRLYDDGRYAEVLAEVEKAKPWMQRGGEEYADGQFVGALMFNARMKSDFAEGKDVFAEAPPCYPGWRDYGWWRSGNCVWDTYPNQFKWEKSLTWRAELPWAHELEFSVTEKPKTEGRHVLIVSRFQHERSHWRPINKLPYFTFIWEKDRTGLLVDNDYYHMFDVPSAAAIWTAANSPSRKIRIVCDGERISVFLDERETPVWSSAEYAGAIRRARPFGFARFRGDNVRLSGVRVRKPKSAESAR